MNLKIYTEQDLELIKLIKNNHTNNGLCYQMGWELDTLKTRLAVLFQLAEVKNKTELKAKFKYVNIVTML